MPDVPVKTLLKTFLQIPNNNVEVWIKLRHTLRPYNRKTAQQTKKHTWHDIMTVMKTIESFECEGTVK